MNNTVTFETKCWEEDWKYIIGGGYLRKLRGFEECGFKFHKRVLMINNVNDPKTVCTEADKLVGKNIIDEWHLVSEHEKRVLDEYEIQRDSFVETHNNKSNDGYYYSIAELVAINVIQSDFILHLAGDSNIETNNSYDWISNAIPFLNNRSDIIGASPVWNHCYKTASDDAKGNEDSDWFYISRFSDQCYLIKRDLFNKPIYNDRNERADFYFPQYGGNSFEKRVYAYLKNRDMLTITSKHISYACPNH